jgi:hypothetical protein
VSPTVAELVPEDVRPSQHGAVIGAEPMGDRVGIKTGRQLPQPIKPRPPHGRLDQTRRPRQHLPLGHESPHFPGVMPGPIKSVAPAVNFLPPDFLISRFAPDVAPAHDQSLNDESPGMFRPATGESV